MGFKKVAELVIQGVEDRLTVSSILIKNGYTVGPDKRKRTPTGKTLDYIKLATDLERLNRSSAATDNELEAEETTSVDIYMPEKEEDSHE